MKFHLIPTVLLLHTFHSFDHTDHGAGVREARNVIDISVSFLHIYAVSAALKLPDALCKRITSTTDLHVVECIRSTVF